MRYYFDTRNSHGHWKTLQPPSPAFDVLNLRKQKRQFATCNRTIVILVITLIESQHPQGAQASLSMQALNPRTDLGL